MSDTVLADEEFESVVWSLLQKYRVTVDDATGLIIEIVAAAQAYAASDSETLQRLRREVLRRDNPLRTDGGR